VESLTALSSRFLLWDLDMVALRPLRLSDAAGAPRRQRGGRRVKTYGGSFSRLTGQPLRWAPDGSSFVAHSMVVDSRVMRGMLAAFAVQQPALCGSGGGELAALLHAMPSWAAAVLCSLAPLGEPRLGEHPTSGAGAAAKVERLQLAFSEYASYASWYEQQAEIGAAPPAALQPRGAWTRAPLGSKALLAVRAALLRSGCCPSRTLLLLARWGGWEYTGFEAGHLGSCGEDRT